MLSITCIERDKAKQTTLPGFLPLSKTAILFVLLLHFGSLSETELIQNCHCSAFSCH